MSQGSPPPPATADRRSSPSPEPNSKNQLAGEETTAADPPPPPPTNRSNRPSRACVIRAAARLCSLPAPAIERKPKAAKRERRREEVDSPPPSPQHQQCGKIVTPLVEPPPSPSRLPRWNLRCMWELAAVLNFLHLFRPLLNISLEFSAEEFETALLTPNDTLSDIHMPLLKAIPPITRMALTRDTWITVLCRKLRDWWHWVADGDLPIVASQGGSCCHLKSIM